MVVNWYAPHAPYVAPPPDLHTGEVVGLTVEEQHYNWMIEAMDHEMGRVMDAVDLNRTTVFFTADNGTPGDVISPPSTTAKVSLYEGGVRVPLIAAGLGVQRANETSDHLVQLEDLHATLAALASIEEDLAIDGRSFSNSLTDPAAAPHREHALASRFAPEGFAPTSATIAIRDAFHKLILSSEAEPELYLLGAAPREGAELLAGRHHPRRAARTGSTSGPGPARALPAADDDRALSLGTPAHATAPRFRGTTAA